MSFLWSKPYDLEALYEKWIDAPVFDGAKPNLKKGRLDVDTWLNQIEAGCKERKVPKDLWHKVAQHYMGKNAFSRLNEVEKVLLTVYGPNFRWDWKKFQTTMGNIRWSIDSKVMVPLGLKRFAESIRRMVSKKEKTPEGSSANKPSDTPTQKVVPSSKRSLPDSKSEPGPALAGPKTGKKAEKTDHLNTNGTKKSVKADASSAKLKGSIKTQLYMPTPTDQATELIINAPLWLLQTCCSLEGLAAEYPKTMSILAAVLITVGSVPALPAVSAGAAGVFLASGAAHTIGSVAVGLGTWIAAQSQMQTDKSESGKG